MGEDSHCVCLNANIIGQPRSDSILISQFGVGSSSAFALLRLECLLGYIFGAEFVGEKDFVTYLYEELYSSRGELLKDGSLDIWADELGEG
jgi:hypothetical protein